MSSLQIVFKSQILVGGRGLGTFKCRRNYK
uniref:Uncharacterized protein n=1 Tax=Arundo donax TaxID=35708 RepID=A0A0A9BMV3_ARUDO